MIDDRPQFAVFELNVEELIAARDLTRRGIMVASWLAVEARKELCRFQEFIFWLRFGAFFCSWETCPE